MGHYYHVCPECMARLDPGERCDCREMDDKARERADKPEGDKLSRMCGAPLMGYRQVSDAEWRRMTEGRKENEG